MNQFKNLLVWQKAVELAVEVYQVTASFPKEELFGLTSQIRKSSTSVAFNIAEGAGRKSTKDFNHFLDIALGSSCELETQLVISERLRFSDEIVKAGLTLKIEEIQKMINGLQKSNSNK
jgi:four helix bundle protein